MLAAFFRGAFLVGILAWYSISVWKMIDGYFRDQFASYLHEEYRKNPRMRTDVREEANAADKSETVFTDGETPLERIRKLAESESCPVGKEENADDRGDSCDILEVSRSDETAREEELPREEKVIVEEIERAENSKEKVEERMEEKEAREEKPRRKKLALKRETVEAEREKLGKKKRVRTITLREEDFLSVKRRRGSVGRDEDFWEFEEEEEEEEGIRIADLPFKPRVDVGRLERVTDEEYCPLTLEDEVTCGETKEWSY